jgi:hypothetical protein
MNPRAYGPNPVSWVDPLGWCAAKKNVTKKVDPFGVKLKAQLRLEQRLSQGRVHTSGGPLKIGGSNRAAVFDTKTGQLYVGQTNHIGVVTSHGLPVQSGRYVGGFTKVTSDGAIHFIHLSGTFPGAHASNAIGKNVDDMMRGIGIRVDNPL